MAYREMEVLLEDRLRNTGQEKDGFLICYSGTPMSGKSSLARIIQERYDAVRIENDTIREISSEAGLEVDIYSFLAKFLKSYSYPNKRIVLDSSIDRNFEQVRKTCREKNFRMFKVKMEVPEDFDDRAREREGVEWSETGLSKPEKYVEDQEELAEKVDFDFVMGEDGGTKALLEKLDAKIS